MLNNTEIQQRQRAIVNAIAQQELEGLKVPAQVIVDMQNVARGELSTDDVIRKIYSRFPDVEIFKPR